MRQRYQVPRLLGRADTGKARHGEHVPLFHAPVDDERQCLGTHGQRRLRDRRTDSEEVITRRLQEARGDLSHWDEFDYVIINDDLDTAVGELEEVLLGTGAANQCSNPELRQKLKKILV